MLFSKKTIQIIKKITNSTYLDIIGLVIVISASIALDYHKTVFNFSFQGKKYVFMLGYLSILNTGFSMIGNRLVTKKNNIGNFITTCNSFLSGTIDYLLGNKGAVLTYPVSVISNFLVFKAWKKNRILRSIDFIFYRNLIFGGTLNTARMYPDNWIMWQIYNLTKLIQNLLLMNIANTAKYIFYFFNAIIGYITWNDDKKTTT